MSERKTIHKWWWVWDFEKEEQWLNNMAMDGWVLDGVGFCTYHFVQCEPGEYIVHLEMANTDSGYMDFMKEIHVEYIGRVAKWMYYRRNASYGFFEINSDIDSRIKHLNRIARMLYAIGMMNIVLGITNSINTSGFGFINLLCGCVLMYGLGRIHGKKDELERERTLHE